MANYYKQNLRYHLLLMLVTPILGLIYGIRTGSLKIMRWTIFVFTVIYGSLLTFQLFGGEKGADKGADGARHLNHVYEHYTNLDFAIWWKELVAIMMFNPLPTTNDDPFIHVIAYLAGTVFGSPSLFFTLVAIVYGYFFSGAIVKILSYINWKSGYNKFYFTFFLVLLVLWKLPNQIQTVRTWTGMWVLIYAVLSYYETKKWKYLLLALTPVFIHIGYYALAFPIWIVLFSGYRNPKIYFIIFIFSIFISNAVEQIGFLDFAQQTEVSASKTRAYYVDDAREKERQEETQKSQNNFYKKYEENKIHHYVLSGMVIFMFIFLRDKGFSKLENTLFSYGLAGASFSNFFVSIYAVHNRGWFIAGFFIISLLVIFLSKNNLDRISFASLKVKFPLFLFSLSIFPFILFFLSSFLNITSVYILLLPILSWIDSDAGISIRATIGLFM